MVAEREEGARRPCWRRPAGTAGETEPAEQEEWRGGLRAPAVPTRSVSVLARSGFGVGPTVLGVEERSPV
jgi:hypothetical protein